MADEPTYEGMLAEVNGARQRDARTPSGIRLGAAQLRVIDRFHRESSGLSDVGPLTEFAGLHVLPSKSGDKLEIVYPGDAPPPPETVPSGPDAPAVEDQG